MNNDQATGRCTVLEVIRGFPRKITPAEVCIAANHIRTCSSCRVGRFVSGEQTDQAVIVSCDGCQRLLSEYAEATRTDYPLVEMTDALVLAVALHLSRCSSCQEEFLELTLLSELEERQELCDL